MGRVRSWTDEQLKVAVKDLRSYRAVIIALGLIPEGGNYRIIQREIRELGLSTEHFLGQGWNVGLKFMPKEAIPLEDILVGGSHYQSYKLRNRLIKAKIKKAICELCGWAEVSTDGRVPVELDHINGDRYDNRIENLRILCPNCHSLQPTHRGKNMRKAGT